MALLSLHDAARCRQGVGQGLLAALSRHLSDRWFGSFPSAPCLMLIRLRR